MQRRAGDAVTDMADRRAEMREFGRKQRL